MAFEDSKKKVQTMDALLELRQSLVVLGEMPKDIRIYDYAVHFFNIIARFNDKNTLSQKMFKNATDQVDALGAHLKNAGRDQYGWVRSKKGEAVTLDNLYLGDVYGIWTNTARTFKDMPNDQYVQNVIQNQLRSFINSHREPMIGLINNILKTEKKPNGLMFRLFGKKSVSK